MPPGPFWMDGGGQQIETLCNARTGARHDHVVDQDDPTLFHSLEAGKAGIAGDLIGAGKGRPLCTATLTGPCSPWYFCFRCEGLKESHKGRRGKAVAAPPL